MAFFNLSTFSRNAFISASARLGSSNWSWLDAIVLPTVVKMVTAPTLVIRVYSHDYRFTFHFFKRPAFLVGSVVVGKKLAVESATRKPPVFL